jgi:hypothetical protein
MRPLIVLLALVSVALSQDHVFRPSDIIGKWSTGYSTILFRANFTAEYWLADEGGEATWKLTRDGKIVQDQFHDGRNHRYVDRITKFTPTEMHVRTSVGRDEVWRRIK